MRLSAEEKMEAIRLVEGSDLSVRRTCEQLGIHRSVFYRWYRAYTEHGYARFQASLDRIYEDFTGKVAEGREIPLEEILKIAKGRIWTGEDALELGLVDELGGIDVALRLAREELDLDEDAPIRLKRFPRKRSPFEVFFGEGPDNSERAAIAALAKSLESIHPTVRALRRAVGTAESGVLSISDLDLAESP